MVLFLGIIGFTGISRATACHQDTWTAIIYPDNKERINFFDYGEYTSLAKCRRAAWTYLAFIGKRETGGYTCGKNCKPMNPRDPGPDPLFVCDERFEQN